MMKAVETLITTAKDGGSAPISFNESAGTIFCRDNIANWALAVKKRNATGRGSSKKIDLYGIKKLRELILDLAVRGKLVPQNSEDEPASVLLERIAAEKTALIDEKRIKKQKALPAIAENEKTFELPGGWKWCRLGDLINLVSGQHLKPSEYSNEELLDSVPYITGPAEFGVLNPTYSKYTTLRKALALTGDILITCKGSGIGKINSANTTMAISRQLMSIQPILVSVQYVKFVVSSLYPESVIS